jgi:hypothetical protein
MNDLKVWVFCACFFFLFLVFDIFLSSSSFWSSSSCLLQDVYNGKLLNKAANTSKLRTCLHKFVPQPHNIRLALNFASLPV